jgi:hypothetical protein
MSRPPLKGWFAFRSGDTEGEHYHDLAGLSPFERPLEQRDLQRVKTGGSGALGRSPVYGGRAGDILRLGALYRTRSLPDKK